MSAILSRAMLLEAVDSIVRIDPCGLPGLGQAGITLEPQGRPGLGDLLAGAAWVMAAVIRRPDRLPVDTIGPLAEALAARLRELPDVADARPWHGWVNIWLDDAALGRLLPRLLAIQPWEAPPLAPLHVPLAEMQLDDPWFRIQYIHARCRSVQRAAQDEPALWRALSRRVGAGQPIGPFPPGPRRALLLQIENGARLVEEPDTSVVRMRRHLERLADLFEHVWNDSEDRAKVATATLRFLDRAHVDRTLVDLALVLATADAIRHGLGRHGVAAAEEIR